MEATFVFIVFIGILPCVLTQKDMQSGLFHKEEKGPVPVMGNVRSIPELKTNDEQTCKPFRAYILWDPSNIEDICKVQRHIILRIINNTHEGTSIRLDIMNKTIRTILDMKKDNTNQWVITISWFEYRSSEQYLIPFKSLEGAISKFTMKTETAAEELFFVVDDNSKIDDEENAKKELKKFKTYVVLSGAKPPPKFWTNLATDKHHLLQLNNNVAGDLDVFLNLSCQDSGLYCDTDMYWNLTGKECKACTYICSRTPTEDPAYCRHACPYFRDREDTCDQPKINGCNSLVPHHIRICTAFVFVPILVEKFLR